MSIADLKAGEKGIISSFKDDEIEKKFTIMGILQGSVIEVVRRAPFKGGFYIKADGQNYALRTNEAEEIYIK